MVRAFVSVGSNLSPQAHVRSGVKAMEQAFGPLSLSTVYRSQAVGFSGPDFLNLVAAFDTDWSPEAITQALRRIEDEHGRHRDGPRFASRHLDLDLLLWGDRVQEGPIALPRPEITQHAFVLRPLAELAPDQAHPVSGIPFKELWAAFDDPQQVLEPVPGLLE